VGLKDELSKRGMQLLQDPRVAKLMQDERVMKLAMQAFEVRGKLQQSFDERVDQVAKSLNLATKREVRELRRTLRQMEQELERTRQQSESQKAKGS
jgi:uncharacterized protein YukE